MYSFSNQVLFHQLSQVTCEILSTPLSNLGARSGKRRVNNANAAPPKQNFITAPPNIGINSESVETIVSANLSQHTSDAIYAVEADTDYRKENSKNTSSPTVTFCDKFDDRQQERGQFSSRTYSPVAVYMKGAISKFQLERFEKEFPQTISLLQKRELFQLAEQMVLANHPLDMENSALSSKMTKTNFGYHQNPYISSGSFEIDKRYFGSQGFSFQKHRNPVYLSVRTFKTERDAEAAKERNPSLFMRIKNKLFPKVDNAASPLDQMNSDRLKSLIADLPADEANKLKIAFAEGYIVANPANQRQNSRTFRWLRTLQQVLVIAVFTALLASLLGSFGGGMFRVSVGNGNEVMPEDINVSFHDVKGVDEAKEELQEIVEFLRNPEKFVQLGGKLPKGVLLVGPPGTGKTLLARAVAGEAGVPFFHAAGPEFDEILVGQGARRVRDLFKAAKVKAPCVVFIDEIDSVGAKRTNSVLHPYANQTINQLLSEMDGFRQNEGVIVLGATNRREDLDRALLRPGRFDVEVQVSAPEYIGRKEILDYYLSKVKRGEDIDVDIIARGTTGFTGADLENVVNQAALRAAIEGADRVMKKHLDFARDKVIMGPERKSRIPDEDANKITAYHEGGHALVAHYTKNANTLHKVTIIPRGHSLGHTAYIPEKEQYHVTRQQLMAVMDTMMGGRAAEELIFGLEKITSGAASDLKQATAIATNMVKEWGMSEKVGLRTVEEGNRSLVAINELGPSTNELIDSEIKRLLQESYDRAKSILKLHSKELKALAEALLKYETLDADDVHAILKGQTPTSPTKNKISCTSSGVKPKTRPVSPKQPPPTPKENLL